MMSGLPGSGKSTIAKKMVEEEGFKRINKDDLRAMIDASKWSKLNEKNIIEARDLLVINCLDGGYNVVVDDTNLDSSHRDALIEIAGNCDAEFEEIFVDTPVMVCIERDAKRGEKAVGAEVIMRMYNQYIFKKALYNPDLPQCFIIDIDGTLAKMNGRSPYDYTRVKEDSLNEDVANILDCIRLNKDYKIFIFSGRQASCKEDTIDWLDFHNIPYDGLFMRAADDKRKDSEVKKELYEANIEDKYNVVAVFDDRNQVVDLWRSLGLTCLQCDYGFF